MGEPGEISTGPPPSSKEGLRKPEKLLDVNSTGAQALMLLGLERPKPGQAVPQLEIAAVKEAAVKIKPELSQQINDGSLYERNEHWKDIPKEQRMNKWREDMQGFVDFYTKDTANDPAKAAGQKFLKKILQRDDQASTDEVEITADNIYRTFMLGQGGGDIEFFADRILKKTNNNTDEIEQNKVLIESLGIIYGEKNASKIASLLTFGKANARKDPDKFTATAQENLNRGNVGEDVMTPLENNSPKGAAIRLEENKAEELRKKAGAETAGKSGGGDEKANKDAQERITKAIDVTSRKIKETSHELPKKFLPVLESLKGEHASIPDKVYNILIAKALEIFGKVDKMEPTAKKEQINELLKLFDGFYHVEKSVPDDNIKKYFQERIDLFKSILKSEGIEAIDVEGQKYDTNTMNALGGIEVEVDKVGSVIGDILPGFTMDGELLRKANVAVGVTKSKEDGPTRPEETTPVEGNQKWVKSFKTSDGVFKYEADGKLKFFPANGEQPINQDLAIFVDLTSDEEQEVRHVILRDRDDDKGKELQILQMMPDKTLKVLNELSQITDTNNVFLGILEDGNVKQAKKVSAVPVKGYHVYYTRQLQKDNNEMITSQNLGKKVEEIEAESDQTQEQVVTDQLKAIREAMAANAAKAGGVKSTESHEPIKKAA